jgi:hypothetical protein
MTVGLIELYNKGKEDIFLIGNPEITFFKSIYKKYYNFSYEDKLCNFSTKPLLGYKTYIRLNEYGDLINKMYLRLNFKGNLINSNLNLSIKKPNDINIFKKSPIYIGNNSNQININYSQNISIIQEWKPIFNGNENELDIDNLFQTQDYISFSPKRNIRYVDLSSNTQRYFYNRNFNSDTKYKFEFDTTLINENNIKFTLYKGNIFTSNNSIEILPDTEGFYNFDDYKISSFNQVVLSYKIKYTNNTKFGNIDLEFKGLLTSTENINNTREYFNYTINNNNYGIIKSDTIYINLDTQLIDYNFFINFPDANANANSLKTDDIFIYLYNTKYNIVNYEKLIIKFYDIYNNQIPIINNILNLMNYNYNEIKFNISYNKIITQTINLNKHTYITNNFDINGSFNIINLNTNLNNIIKNISLNLDQNIIDKYNSNWLNINNHYFINNDNQYNIIENLTLFKLDNYSNYFYIPLRFWFNNFTYNSLPLISLKNSEVIINIEFNNKKDLLGDYYFFNNIELDDCKLLCNYIVLDKEQKNFFMNNKLEYLIEQVQSIENIHINSNYNSIENNIKLNLHRPIKYIIWNLPYKYNLEKAKISLNNYDAIEEIDGEYYHSLIPLKLNLKNTKTIYNINENTNKDGTYYIYSFSLNPTEFQPSGSCNFSRIDLAMLHMKIYNTTLTQITKSFCNIYAVNYNMLFIENGKHNLLF